MRYFAPFVVFLSLLSSCVTPGNLPVQSATPSLSFSPSPSAPATQTPLPTATATPTLSPDLNNYQFDGSVSQMYRELVKQAAQSTRYVLIESFGSDFGEGVTILVKNETPERGGFVAYNDRLQPLATPYVYLDTPGFDQEGCKTPEFRYRCVAAVGAELTLFWLWEHGCFYQLDESRYPLTGFLWHGIHAYIGNKVAGISDDAPYYDDSNALMYWSVSHYNSDDWFNAGDVSTVAVKKLIDAHGTMPFAQLCDAVGHGENPYNAFESAFSISVQDFRAKFMEDVLGIQKDCTQATCGIHPGQMDPHYGSLTPLIDYSLRAPNLIIRIVDKDGKPVPDINLQLFRRLYNNVFYGTDGEDNATNSDGILAVPVLPGLYGMDFCAAGYPAYGAGYSGNPIQCVYELNPFEVVSGETKEIDFQYWDIQDSSLTKPNFEFTLLGVDGQPVSSQYVQVCGYDAISTVCLNGQTDKSGVFQASLLPAQYVVRLVQPGQGEMDIRGSANPDYGMNLDPYHGTSQFEYEIRNVKVQDSGVTTLAYQLPAPNLEIEFLDANGSFTPNIHFYLCKSTDGPLPESVAKEKNVTNLILGRVYSDWDNRSIKVGGLDGDCFLKDHTDEHGLFQLRVDPGRYFIYFDNPGSHTYQFYFDHLFSDIIVQDAGVTKVSAQLK